MAAATSATADEDADVFAVAVEAGEAKFSDETVPGTGVGVSTNET